MLYNLYKWYQTKKSVFISRATETFKKLTVDKKLTS